MFEFMTTTLKPRIAVLLHTLQDKQETKIESHGRTASQLVFEKEKLDNGLLKVCSVLKLAGLYEESKWLSKHIATSQDISFKVQNIAEARERDNATHVDEDVSQQDNSDGSDDEDDVKLFQVLISLKRWTIQKMRTKMKRIIEVQMMNLLKKIMSLIDTLGHYTTTVSFQITCNKSL